MPPNSRPRSHQGGFHPPWGTGPEVAARVERQRDSRRHFGLGVAHPMNIQEAGGWKSANPWLTNPRFHRLEIDDAKRNNCLAQPQTNPWAPIRHSVTPVRFNFLHRLHRTLPRSRVSSNPNAPTSPTPTSNRALSRPTFAQHPNLLNLSRPSNSTHANERGTQKSRAQATSETNPIRSVGFVASPFRQSPESPGSSRRSQLGSTSGRW